MADIPALGPDTPPVLDGDGIVLPAAPPTSTPSPYPPPGLVAPPKESELKIRRSLLADVAPPAAPEAQQLQFGPKGKPVRGQTVPDDGPATLAAQTAVSNGPVGRVVPPESRSLRTFQRSDWETLESDRDPDNANHLGVVTWVGKLDLFGDSDPDDAPERDLLNLDERALYVQISVLLSGDPLASGALRRLLVGGHLPGAPAIGGDQGNLLHQLFCLASPLIAQGIDRRALVSAAVRELISPPLISQSGHGASDTAFPAMYLAKTAPAEYVRLMASLARPHGIGETVTGHRLQRVSDLTLEDGGRPWSARLLQPAMLTLVKTDSRGRPTAQDVDRGLPALTSGGLAIALSRLTGTAQVCLQANEGLNSVQQRAALDWIEPAARQTRAVPASVSWKGTDRQHRLLVTRLDSGRVHFINPWGHAQSLAAAEFAEEIVALHLPESAESPPPETLAGLCRVWR